MRVNLGHFPQLAGAKTNLEPGAPIRMPSLEELRRKYDEEEAKAKAKALRSPKVRYLEMEANRAALPKPPWYARERAK